MQGHWKPRILTVPTLPPLAPPEVVSIDNLWRQWRQRQLTGELSDLSEENILR